VSKKYNSSQKTAADVGYRQFTVWEQDYIIVTVVIAILVQASCAVRAYWSELPTVRSGFVIGITDYFVGIKCSSVITLLRVSSSAVIWIN